MPYLKREDKDILTPALEQLVTAVEEARAFRVPAVTYEAAFNYLICRLYQTWFSDGYTARARGLGAIEAAKLELYRRMLAPYENNAAKKNGDIFLDDAS